MPCISTAGKKHFCVVFVCFVKSCVLHFRDTIFKIFLAPHVCDQSETEAAGLEIEAKHPLSADFEERNTTF